MLTVSVLAAIAALIITPPSWELLSDIDWRTLGTLFMMLTVLEGFKKENIFRPLLRLAGNIRSMVGLSLFLVFSVFFSSMFVTNDVSLIIFVPLTIILFRAGGKERYIPRGRQGEVYPACHQHGKYRGCPRLFADALRQSSESFYLRTIGRLGVAVHFIYVPDLGDFRHSDCGLCRLFVP